MDVVSWSQERIGRLETLYRKGWSFGLIAADIGKSRNAVIGKAHRMLLPKREEIAECISRPPAINPPRRKRAIAPVSVVVKRPRIIDPDRNYSCTINQLKNRSCRFPLWTDSAQHHQRLYCGIPEANLIAGRPYCRSHTLLCH
jgi:GcrA cell cycle regulator